MISLLLKYLSMYLSSALKFVFGPALGITFGLSIPEIIIINVLGMMTTIYTITYYGERIHNIFLKLLNPKRKKIFTKRNRQFVKIWRKYGVNGVAFLTPLVFTPPGGAILANAFGGHDKRLIFRSMWISAVFWSFVVTFFFLYTKTFIENHIPLDFILKRFNS
ncbi:MAG TPA: hypothetical protein ACFCUD_13505 [Cyclobacteriaceae bacterium]